MFTKALRLVSIKFWEVSIAKYINVFVKFTTVIIESMTFGVNAIKDKFIKSRKTFVKFTNFTILTRSCKICVKDSGLSCWFEPLLCKNFSRVIF